MIDRLRALDRRILSVSRHLAWLAPLVARVSVGLVFVSTGSGKLEHLDRVIEFFRSLGIPAPELQAPFVAGTELVGGTLLILGLATRFAAVPLAITMIAAIRTALWGELEGAIVLLGWLAIAGGGAVSLDAIAARVLRMPAAPNASAPLHREALTS